MTITWQNHWFSSRALQVTRSSGLNDQRYAVHTFSHGDTDRSCKVNPFPAMIEEKTCDGNDCCFINTRCDYLPIASDNLETALLRVSTACPPLEHLNAVYCPRVHLLIRDTL